MVTNAIALCVNRKYIGKLPKNASEKLWEDHTTSFELEVMGAQAIAATIRAGHAIAAVHHDRRHTDNFLSAQHIASDFDTEDDRSTLAALSRHSFIGQHAAILHTTTSHTPEAPRARAVYILDQPIKDAKQYARYTAALVWYLDQSDPQCKDAARLWFGAQDCEIQVLPENVLPVAVLEEITQQHEAYMAEQRRTLDIDPTIDIGQALDLAIKRAQPGNRNVTGFWLACKLRDSGMAQADAQPLMQAYQITFENSGDHPYAWDEALASLRSAYSHRPCGHTTEQVSRDLAMFESFAWNDRKGLKEGGIHYSLKTVMGVSETARKANRTQGIDLPIRDFNQFGVPPATAARHLKVMVNAGLLKRNAKSKGARATTYSINIDLLRELAKEAVSASGQSELTFDVAQSATYHRLQEMAWFRQGARIDARFWTTEPPAETFGPTVQRLIATLAECGASHDKGNRGHSETIISKRPLALLDCLTMSPIRSMAHLFTLAGVNARTGKRKLQPLMALGIVGWEYAPDDNRTKLPYLVENWYEKLIEIEPALTTFGHDVLLAQQHDMQRHAYHSRYTNFCKGGINEIATATADAAGSRLKDYPATIRQYNTRRQAWAKSQGITHDDIPTISLHGEGGQGRVQQPVKAAKQGRKVVPTGRTHIGKNSLLKSEVADRQMQPDMSLLNRPLTTEEVRRLTESAQHSNYELQWQRMQLGNINSPEFGVWRNNFAPGGAA